MANVVLVFAQFHRGKNDRPPLGILYLAAVLLKNGFSVQLIDETVQENARALLLQHMTSDTICVGVSTLGGEMLQAALDVSRFVRKHRPDLPIVWGNCFPTSAPESTLKNDMVDAVCIGEGESSFVKMVKAFRDGTALSSIPGIGYKINGKPILTEQQKEFFDLDTLPPLPYHLVDIDLYKPLTLLPFFGFKSKRILSLETSRGCPFRCGYCIQSVKKEPFRSMSPNRIIEFVKDAAGLGAGALTINDDNFFSNPKKAIQVLEAIKNLNLKLELFIAVRSDYLNAINGDTFKLIKESGVKLFGIGVESGSNSMLKRLCKGETVEVTYKVNRRLAKFGIHAWFHFIVGFPGETLEDIIATYRAMTRILKENRYAKISNKKLIPLPNTPVYEECIERGMSRPETIEDWIKTEDLQWVNHAPYLDKAAENWFWNTRYYNDLMIFLSNLRIPNDTIGLKLLRCLTVPLFYCFSWLMFIRFKYKISGYFIDSFVLSPLAYFFRTLLFLARYKK